MKKLLAIFLMHISMVHATETITIVSPYSPGNTGQAALIEVTEKANQRQARYKFIVDHKPGAQGLVALNHAQASSENRVAIIAAGAVELFDTGKVNIQDWSAIHGIGDACWAVVTNWPVDENQGTRSIKAPAGAKDFVIGAHGLGSVAHLTGLEVAEKLGQKPILVLFKSGTEAFLNLAGNQGVNMTMESVQNIENMKLKNPDIKMLGIGCNQRHPLAPHVPTLHEQGLRDIPPVFNIVLAPAQMPAAKKQDIGKILDQATLDVGPDRIFTLSGFRPAVAQKISAQEFFDRRVGQILKLRKKYAQELRESK
jgi:tripartite-type tricarboxylate transporter receptor subunit TctC